MVASGGSMELFHTDEADQVLLTVRGARPWRQQVPGWRLTACLRAWLRRLATDAEEPWHASGARELAEAPEPLPDGPR